MKLRQCKRLLRLLWRDLVGSGTLRSLWVFCACLVMGVTLIAACSSLLRLVEDGLSSQQRQVFGGDLVFSTRSPLPAPAINWLESNAELSLLTELRTMLGTESGDFTVVELQSVDEAYPLYGQVRLQPEQSLQIAVQASEDGVWGAAFDPVLAATHGLQVGQRVNIGQILIELRAEIVKQPDRSLNANTRGPPLIIDGKALQATGLLGPTSLVDFDYRVKTDELSADVHARFRQAFPDMEVEIRTLAERSEMIGRRLDQVASVLLLIGLTTLFIGGLGVANSIAAWVASKRTMLACLQALGARQWQIGFVFVGQVLFLAILSSSLGALIGSSIAWFSSRLLVAALPISSELSELWWPSLLAIAFGVFAALGFALPDLGRVLQAKPVMLLRSALPENACMGKHYQRLTAVVLLVAVVLMSLLLPEPLLGLVFLLVAVVLVLLLDGLIVLLRAFVKRLRLAGLFEGRFALQIAAANLYRPGNTLRAMLLSLGSALTLLTAAILVIVTMVNSLNNTVPERSPALVFYDVQATQHDEFDAALQALPGYDSHALVPLVLGRMTHINGQPITERGDLDEAEEANDEHKLSYRDAAIDNTSIASGAWWPEYYQGPALVAFEDREANQLGLEVGDELRFNILGEPLDAKLAAIYSQARFETRFWLEGVFSPEVLDPWITRYIGSLHLAPGQDVSAMQSLGAEFPNVVTIRTSLLLANARGMLQAAAMAIGLIGLISLSASLLVMSSVIAATTQRRVYESTIMFAIGARHSDIRRSLLFEYLLLGLILTLFAMLLGAPIAWAVLVFWLKLEAGNLWLSGFLIAAVGSALCLTGGAMWLMRSLRVSPAMLLRRGG